MGRYQVTTCEKCRLKEHRKQIVNGKGSLKPRVLFVGEAPGAEEDEAGKPFVGAAGRTLYSQIVAAGLKDEALAWSNVCRCRPPNNRTPLQDEIDCCVGYLYEEIQSYKDSLEFIVALGDTAAFALTGLKTNPHRGMVLKPPELPCPILITSHPSRSFHERAYYDVIIWDMYKVFWDDEMFENRTEGYLINPSVPEAMAWFDKASTKPWVAVDIETVGKNEDDGDKGLNPQRDLITGIGFCCGKGDALHVSGTRMKECWSMLKKFLETHEGLIYHNNRFDRAFLSVAGIESKLSWDTMSGIYLFNPDFPIRKLDFLRSVHTNIEPYKHKYWVHHDIDLGLYNCLDVDCTWQIREAQEHMIKPELMKRMCGESDVALHMMLRGVRIEKNVLAAHWLDYKPKMLELAEKFRNKWGVEIGSNKQLSELLYGKLALSYQRKSVKKTIISVDDGALEYAKRSLYGGREAFPEQYECLEEIQEYRDCQKIIGTYCEGMFKLIQPDGRIHPWWKPEGTDTGRWACRNPNLQNIPFQMKDIIVPEEGKVYLYADYDRLEVWISAIVSGDEDLLELLESGVDIHGVLQKEIAQFYPAITRVQAKTTLFGTFYGRGTRDIAEQFRVPTEIAKGWQDMIFGKFKKLGQFFRKTIPEQFEEFGYMTSFYGRVKYADKITEAMNFPIQSAASDTLNNALIALDKAGFHPILNQHDACVCEEEDTSRWDEFINIMQTSSPLMRKVMNASGGMGYNWKELTDDKMHEAIERELEEGATKDYILGKYSISELAFDTLF